MKRFLLCLIVAGCAAPSPAPVEEPSKPEAQKPTETVAVAGLMESARADAAAGRLTNAAASLERALRLEPRNPRLWQELARVRLKQGDFTQAENLAARSSTWAGNDSALRAENWRVIAQAREAMGDGRGAQAARDNAERMAR